MSRKRGRLPRAEFRRPYVHVGEVIAVGGPEAGVVVGDLVYTMSLHASHARVDAAQRPCIKVPECVPAEEATFVRLATVPFTSIRTSVVARAGDRAAVVGLGLVGNLGAQLLREAGMLVTGVDLVAQRRELANRTGIETTIDPRAGGSVRPEHRLVLEASGTAKGTMTALELAECDDMIGACANAGVTLMVGFIKRFDKSMAHAKQLIEQGTLGVPLNVLCDWRGQQPVQQGAGDAIRHRAFSWRGQMRAWGGVYQDTGSHTTDLARWWLGDIKSVSGEFSVLNSAREVEDSAVGVYLHEGGRRSVHLIGYSHRQSRELYQIDGSKATLEIEYGPSSFSSTDPFQWRLYERGGKLVHDETRYNNIVLDEELRTGGRYKVELDHFCECVLAGKPPLTSGLDGRKAIDAINAVYVSAYLGEKVHLPLESTPDLERIFADMKARSPRLE